MRVVLFTVRRSARGRASRRGRSRHVDAAHAPCGCLGAHLFTLSFARGRASFVSQRDGDDR